MADQQIKQRKQLTHIKLKDGRILVSESTPEEIYDWINSNSHILIQGEMLSKYEIDRAYKAKVDDLENFILNQPQEIQDKIRDKKLWLKKNRGSEMTYKYAVNYVNIILSTQNT